MALEDYNNTRRYTKYKRHVNESNEVVNANTVNSLQADIQVQQLDTTSVKDTAFEERVYTIFNNNLYVNAMFIDYYKTGEYFKKVSSVGTEIDYNTSQMKLSNGCTAGTAISTTIHSVHGADVALNDFFLISNEYIPTGASIKYYIQNNAGERFPITANALKLPLHLSQSLKYGFEVIMELKANSLGESPVINGYAVLYFDTKVEENYGLTNPDLMRFP